MLLESDSEGVRTLFPRGLSGSEALGPPGRAAWMLLFAAAATEGRQSLTVRAAQLCTPLGADCPGPEGQLGPGPSLAGCGQAERPSPC